MNTKFYTKDRKEVKLGEPFKVRYSKGENKYKFYTDYMLEYQAKMLVKDGVLVEKGASSVPSSLQYYSEKVAERFYGMPNSLMCRLINILYGVYPQAALNMLLREVAIEIDKKYSDHIEKSDKIYTVSMVNGRITEVPRGTIKNFRHFAAFRTIEDAKQGCKIVRALLKDMFSTKKNGRK